MNIKNIVSITALVLSFSALGFADSHAKGDHGDHHSKSEKKKHQDSDKKKHKKHVHQGPSKDKKAHADHDDHTGHDHSDQKATLKRVGKDKLVIKVKGMVCAFCAQGIEKNFNKQKEVKSTKVDLDTMEVTIQLKPGKDLSEAVIKKTVTDAGFGYSGIKK